MKDKDVLSVSKRNTIMIVACNVLALLLTAFCTAFGGVIWLGEGAELWMKV